MAQIRVKRTGTALSNPQLLSGEFGIVNETVYYGKYYNDNALHPALKLAGQNIANTFTVLPQLDSTLHASLSSAGDYTIIDKKYVDDAKASALVKINSTTGSNTYTITSGDTDHLTVGTADANHDIKIALKNIAFLDRNVTFQQNVTVTGNLIVNGTTTTLDTQTLTVKDNLIVTNSEGADISANDTNSGLAIRINKNTANNAYGFVYNEGELKIGVGTIDAGNFESTSLQSVLTRTGLSTTANQMVYWDYANKTLRALTVASPLSFSGSTLSLGKITVANLGSGLITGNAERGSIVNGGNGAAYNVSNSIATQTQLGVVKIGNNLNIGTDGQLNGIVQEASSNKIPITGWTATTGDETTYGEYKFEVSFGRNGINYTDINYAVEVVQTISETDGTGQYIEAPATIVKDNAANKLIVYTNNNSWNGYVIATSGGKLDSSSNAGHQIYNRTGTTNGTALPSRANLAFGEGLIASDHSDTGSSVVKLYVSAGNGITITNNKQTIIAAKDARSTVAGVVKLGHDTIQNVPANNPSSNMGRTYAIQKNSSGQLVVNVPWEGSTYTNRTLQFKNSEIVVGTFNSLDASDLSSISFNNAIQASRDHTNSNQIIITDVLATMNRQGTVVAGYNSGTTSHYTDGLLDVDIDCGDWT